MSLSTKDSVLGTQHQDLRSLEGEFLRLTDKQRLFAEARATGMTTAQAQRAAGIAETTAYEYENHPRIKAILQGTARVALRRIAINREDVLEGLMDAVHASQTSTELTAAWREIGKLVGAYEPEQVKHTHIHKTQEQMEQLSDEELLKLADHEGFTLEGEFTVEDMDAIPDELEVTELDELGLDLPNDRLDA